MKILILGAGQVGRTAASHLSREPANEVTVVDTNEDVLRDLQDRLDIRAVAGHASYPSVLEAAGIADTDVLVALTSSDEVNMVACSIAHTLHRTRTKIARIRASEYTRREQLFTEGALAVDVWISPEKLVTDYIMRLLSYPGALQVADFADGRVQLVGVRARREGLLVGRELRTLREHLPDTEARVAAIYRNERLVPTAGDTVIEEHDEIFFVAASDDLRRVMAELRRSEDPVRRLVIAGGRQHRPAARGRAREEQPGQDHRARSAARAAHLRDPREHDRAGRRCRRRGAAGRGEHRQRRRVRRADELRGGERDVGDARQAARGEARDGARQPACLRRADGEPQHRPGDLPADDHDRARCWPMCAAATSCGCTRCGAAPPRRSRRSCTARRTARRSSAGGSSRSSCRRAPASSRSCAARTVIMAHHDTMIATGDHVILFLSDRRQIERSSGCSRATVEGLIPDALGIRRTEHLQLAAGMVRGVLPAADR